MPTLAMLMIALILLGSEPYKMEALIWVHLIASSVGAGIAVWLAESRRFPKALIKARARSATVLLLSAHAVMLSVLFSPLFSAVRNVVSPKVIPLIGGDAKLMSGSVNKIDAKNEWVIEISPKSDVNSVIVDDGVNNGWQEYQSDISYNDETSMVRSIPIPPKSSVCVNCAGDNSTFQKFLSSSWPFGRRSQISIEAKLILRGFHSVKDGDKVRFGEPRIFALKEERCIVSEGPYKLWDERDLRETGLHQQSGGILSPTPTQNLDFAANASTAAEVASNAAVAAMDAAAEVASNAADAAMDAAASVPSCDPEHGYKAPIGTYRICYYADDAYASDCGGGIGRQQLVRKTGEAKFALAPVQGK